MAADSCRIRARANLGCFQSLQGASFFLEFEIVCYLVQLETSVVNMLHVPCFQGLTKMKVNGAHCIFCFYVSFLLRTRPNLSASGYSGVVCKGGMICKLYWDPQVSHVYSWISIELLVCLQIKSVSEL